MCPFQHLVEQWVEELKLFNIEPIIGYSNSPQKNWKILLKNSVLDQKLKVNCREFFCFICTNATFSSIFVQKHIDKIKGNALLVVDEAHNLGSARLSSLLPTHFDYRIALSATFERFRDEEGTDKLKSYFGDKCIEYTMERAIEDKKLTRYKYYPVLVHLSDYELDVYNLLSRELAKCIIKDKNGIEKLNEKGKRIAIKRARLIAGAKHKIETLKKVIMPYKNRSHILVYCGATTILGEQDDYLPVEEDDLRQIDAVTKMLGNELNMKVSQFTSRENIKERANLKNKFEKGEDLQALIAIKCLDEGVNIPKIKTAFILASTTNPKEYIQRRGRVLRLAESKFFAEIYDFITIPRPLDEVISLTDEEMKRDLSLIRKEVNRSEEFARISMTYMEADSIIQRIKDVYGLDDEPVEYTFE